jgi:hypothetical protein
MTTEEIEQTTDIEVLKKRLTSKEIRKKERRLVWRKIGRLTMKAKEETKA